jgi:hypothetical protein
MDSALTVQAVCAVVITNEVNLQRQSIAPAVPKARTVLHLFESRKDPSNVLGKEFVSFNEFLAAFVAPIVLEDWEAYIVVDILEEAKSKPRVLVDDILQAILIIHDLILIVVFFCVVLG